MSLNSIRVHRQSENGLWEYTVLMDGRDLSSLNMFYNSPRLAFEAAEKRIQTFKRPSFQEKGAGFLVSPHGYKMAYIVGPIESYLTDKLNYQLFTLEYREAIKKQILDHQSTGDLETMVEHYWAIVEKNK